MMDTVLGVGKHFLGFVTGDEQSQTHDAPTSQGPDHEAEIDDPEGLSPRNYTSQKGDLPRRNLRRQRSKEQEIGRERRLSPGLQTKAQPYTTDEQRANLPPRHGDTRDAVAIPIPMPGSFAPAPSNRLSRIHGGVRPRNDLATRNGISVAVKKTDGPFARGQPSEPPAKKRKVIEGDGYERSQHFTNGDNRRRGLSQTFTGPGQSIDRSAVRKRHFEAVQRNRKAADVEAIQDDDADQDAKRGREFNRRSSRHGGPPNPLQLRIRDGSPDELTSAGPTGNYVGVKYIGQTEPTQDKTPARPSAPAIDGTDGFRLKFLRVANSAIEDPDLYLVPQKGGNVYKIWCKGGDTGKALRLKDILHGFYHNESMSALIELSPTAGPSHTLGMEFKTEKDRIAFFNDIVPKLGSRAHEAKSASGLAQMARDPRFGTPDENNDRSVASFLDTESNQKPRFAKLKDRLKTANGDAPGYKSGAIDETIAGVRHSKNFEDAAVRRSGRTRVSRPSSFEIEVQPAPESFTMPTVPDHEKYSVNNALPSWKHPLTYPTTGKNRATVNRDDLCKLDEGELLNDNIINFYVRYQEEKLKETNPDLSKRVYWFNTYFFSSLTTSASGRKLTKDINYDAVKSWTRNVDIFGYDYVIVPIVESMHWYLALVCNISQINQKPEDQTGGIFEDQDSQLPELRGDAAEKGHSPQPEENFSDPMLLDEDEMTRVSTKNTELVLPGNSNPGHSHTDTEPDSGQGMAANEQSQDLSSSLIEVAHPKPVSGLPELSQSRSVDDIFASIASATPSRDPSAAPGSGAHGEQEQREDLTNLLTDLEQNARRTPRRVDDSEAAVIDELDSDAPIAKDQEINLVDQIQDPEPAQQSAKVAKRKKGRPVPPSRRFDPDQPAIITLDSLGLSHFPAIRSLKEYLVKEGSEKAGRQIDKTDIQGMTATGIPNQNNFVDCGLYLLCYVDEFVVDPKIFATKLLRKSFDAEKDWNKWNASYMRKVIRDVLIETHAILTGELKKDKAARKKARLGEDPQNQVSGTSNEDKPHERPDSAAVAVTDTAGVSKPSFVEADVQKEDRVESDLTHAVSEKPMLRDAEPKSRGEALEAALPLDEELVDVEDKVGTDEKPEAEVLEVEAVEIPPSDGPIAILEDTPPSTRKIRIEVPTYTSWRTEIPESPGTPPEDGIESRHFLHPKPPTPARPKKDSSTSSGGSSKKKKGVARAKGGVQESSPDITRQKEVIYLD